MTQQTQHSSHNAVTLKPGGVDICLDLQTDFLDDVRLRSRWSPVILQQAQFCVALEELEGQLLVRTLSVGSFIRRSQGLGLMFIRDVVVCPISALLISLHLTERLKIGRSFITEVQHLTVQGSWALP